LGNSKQFQILAHSIIPVLNLLRKVRKYENAIKTRSHKDSQRIPFQ